MAMQNKEDLPGVESPMQDAVRNVQVNVPITREEAARIVTRALFLTDSDALETVSKYHFDPTAAKTYGVPSYIPDWNNISPEYKFDVYFAYMSGIMNGDDVYLLRPQSNFTRSETSTIIGKLTGDVFRPDYKTVDSAKAGTVSNLQFLASEAYKNALIDAGEIILDAEPIRYNTNINDLLKLACRVVIQENQTYQQRGANGEVMYKYTDERINKIREAAQGTFYENYANELMDEIKAGKFWN